MSNPVTTDLLAAAALAARKHKSQRRSDLDATPYINHPLAVAELIARVGGVTDIAVLQAALLHDTVEDTNTTGNELESLFGKEVRRLVEEVTDDKALPKAERKRLQIEHAHTLSAGARLIKLADKTCNISELTPTVPVGWTLQRKTEYLDWAEKVVAKIRGTNGALEARFDEVLLEKRHLLGQ